MPIASNFLLKEHFKEKLRWKMGNGIEENRTFNARGGAENYQELEEKGMILRGRKMYNRN
jgi:hypothetical protein